MKMSYLISGRTTFPTDWWYKLGSTCHKKPFTWSSRWRRFISEFQLLSGISVHVLVIDFVTPSGHEGSRPDVRFCKLFQVWNWYLVKVIWILFFFLARAKINPHEILSQFQVLKYPPILIDFKFSKLFRFGNLAHLLRFKWISNQMSPLIGSLVVRRGCPSVMPWLKSSQVEFYLWCFRKLIKILKNHEKTEIMHVEPRF